ncbi:hypothetical protein HYT45_00870 [Candidatus Uhrbacteria bacterium]|nr:hypothetical protein [Candidatus Uhrbacteria bacterium]
MAKPTTYATPICAVLTILAVVGILLGLKFQNAIIALLLLLPSVGYEVYRTEGKSTRWASWALLATFIAELIFFIFNISLDLAKFFGDSQKYIAGFSVPLGDIKVVGSVLMIVLGVILFTRTRGIYTKWLAVIIFATSFAIVYILAPNMFEQLLKLGINQVLNYIRL